MGFVFLDRAFVDEILTTDTFYTCSMVCQLICCVNTSMLTTILCSQYFKFVAADKDVNTGG